jgi:hypothetical protein
MSRENSYVRSEMVGHRQDAVKIVIKRKWTNGINSHTVPTVIGDREWMEGSSGFLSGGLSVKTFCARWNVHFF